MKRYALGGPVIRTSLCFLGLLVSGCAGIQAGRPSPGKLAGGVFTPGRPAAEAFGPNATLSCHAAGLIQILTVDAANGKTLTADGQLCAVAEMLLGWDKTDPPPQRLLEFAAWHLGLAQRPRAIVSPVATEDVGDLAVAFKDPLAQFAGASAHPHYGIATTRLAKGSTRVALVMLDPTVELGPLPRHLPAGGQATVQGHLAAPLENAKLLTSDSKGHLETAAVPASGDFKADLHCGDKPGRIQVELRGEEKGAGKVVLSFPVFCGAMPPATLALSQPGSWPDDPAQQAKKILEMINAERTAAGLSELAWDNAVAGVAQTAAESLREDGKKGGGVPMDPVPLLQKADAMSPVVVENPGLALTSEEAQFQFMASPMLRANLMNPEVTQVGVGVAPSKTPEGVATAYVVELFTRQLATVDAAATAKELLKRVEAKRAEAKVNAVKTDPTLDAAAKKYAAALAGAKGVISNAQSSEILTPLYRAYKSLNIFSAVKADPLTAADEPGVVGKGAVIGIGVAQGTHPSLGKNAGYVVFLLGTHR